jgi:hypothetical protein
VKILEMNNNISTIIATGMTVGLLAWMSFMYTEQRATRVALGVVAEQVQGLAIEVAKLTVSVGDTATHEPRLVSLERSNESWSAWLQTRDQQLDRILNRLRVEEQERPLSREDIVALIEGSIRFPWDRDRQVVMEVQERHEEEIRALKERLTGK